MPGFALAKAVPLDLSKVHALILSGLGIVTFHDDAQQAYETLVELVTMAEERVSVDQAGDVAKAPEDLELLAELRAAVAAQRGHTVVCSLDASPEAIAYSSREDIDELAVRGPLTPRNGVHTPAVVGDDISASLSRFAEMSNARFEQHAGPEHVMHAAPSTVVWKNRGIVSFGRSAEEAQRVADIARHASDTIQCVEAKSAWTPVAAAEVFAVVFRQLAEEPLTPTPVHLGKVAVVTGAAAGIGLASAQTLAEDGATVIGLDIHPDIVESMGGIGGTGLVVDLTSDEQIIEALHTVVRTHGGLDILVSNAGIFTAGSHLEDLESDDWDRSMAVNLTSHQRLLKHAIPYLKHGIDAAIVIMGSRNVNAPGAGAASYSCAKAALTQLCRIAALELAADGVRVNIVHPDAVFDTKLWTPEALQRSADRYGMSVEEYKSRNLMKTEIRSKNVGMMVSAVAGAPFAKTTGAQIPVDGGNDRII
jgi:NAD(P)-dependent dehydrogenase (short-subunit alcohol dehydrogenase family)